MDAVASRVRQHWPAALPALVVLAAWTLAAAADLASDRVLPSIGDVVSAVPHVFVDDSSRLSHAVGVTMAEVGIGFGCACAAALALGALIALSSRLRRVLYPLIVIWEIIPKIALLPLLIVGFGYGVSSKAVIVGLLSFFPVFINTMKGLDYPGKDGDELLRSLGASALQRLRYFGAPRALPPIFAGIKIGLTLAFIAAIVAELLTISDGLGALIDNYKQQLRIDYAYAVTILVAGIGTGLFFLMDWIERRVVFWSRDSQLTAGL